MTLTFNLSPELESQLHEQASSEGIDAQAYVLSLVAADLRKGKREQATAPRLSPEKSRLLIDINRGIPDKTWQRYQELVTKRQDESISPVEMEELILLTNEVERVSVERFGRLVEFARLQSVDVRDLMHQLGIPDPSYA